VPTSDAPTADETTAKAAEKVPPLFFLSQAGAPPTRRRLSTCLFNRTKPALVRLCAPPILNLTFTLRSLDRCEFESTFPPPPAPPQRAMWISIATLLFSIPALIGA